MFCVEMYEDEKTKEWKECKSAAQNVIFSLRIVTIILCTKLYKGSCGGSLYSPHWFSTSLDVFRIHVT